MRRREICTLFRDIKYGSMLCTEQSVVVINTSAAYGRVSVLRALGLGGDGGFEAHSNERMRVATWKVCSRPKRHGCTLLMLRLIAVLGQKARERERERESPYA